MCKKKRLLGKRDVPGKGIVKYTNVMRTVMKLFIVKSMLGHFDVSFDIKRVNKRYLAGVVSS
jgi:hypothetical protein